MNEGDSESVYSFLKRGNKIYFQAVLLFVQRMWSWHEIMPDDWQMPDSVKKKMDCMRRFWIRSTAEKRLQHSTWKVRDNQNRRVFLWEQGRNRLLHSVYKKGERNSDIWRCNLLRYFSLKRFGTTCPISFSIMMWKRYFPSGSMRNKLSPVDTWTWLICFRSLIFVFWCWRQRQMQFLGLFWPGASSKISRGMWAILKTSSSS